MVETFTLKENISGHIVQIDKFKTKLVTIYLTKKISREDVTKNALLPFVLKRGSENYPTQEEINRKLDYLYGASLDCSADIRGDNSVIRFQINVIDDKYKYDNFDENIFEEALELLFDIVYNPKIEDNHFCEEYVEKEKENLKKIIDSRIDDKRSYSMERCIEELYKGKPYGVVRTGYKEDVEKIDSVNLYEHFIKFLDECKIDIYFSGDFSDVDIKNMLLNNRYLSKFEGRKDNYISEKVSEKFEEEEKNIVEKMDVSQGNLVLGLVNKNVGVDEISLAVANAILGVGANSKLFQNVREKASLAYYAGSMFVQQKNLIIIRAGIEIKNYEKALELIRKQIEVVKKGAFSDDEISSAKEMLISPLLGIEDEQGLEVAYEFRNELFNAKMTKEDKITKIQNTKKEDIMEAIKDMQVKIVYFLRN